MTSEVSLEPHRFAHGDDRYEVRFERAADGWIARIRRDGDPTVHVLAFPEGAGFDPDDVRGSLIAGCRAALAHLPARTPTGAPTRH